MDKSSHFLFFADNLTSDTVTLDAAESRHAASVLRLQPGATLRITDGNGCMATGIGKTVTGSALTVRITGRTLLPRRSPEVSLCIGLPDRDAFESILTNATALGVARIVPIAAQYCQKKWWAADWEKPASRFRQKMIAALKQSHNVYLPELTPPCSTKQAMQYTDGATVLAADPSGKPLCDLQIAHHNSIACFIGPPGGFSSEELQLFEEKSFTPVSIAPSRLRTELAVVVICAQVIGYYL